MLARLVRMMMLGALAASLAGCRGELDWLEGKPLPPKPLNDFASQWALSVKVWQLEPAPQRSAGGAIHLVADIGLSHPRPANLARSQEECFKTDDSFQVLVNGEPLKGLDGNPTGVTQFVICLEPNPADASSPFGEVHFSTVLEVPEGAAPAAMVVTVSDPSRSMEMIVPGLIARHAFRSSDSLFPLDPASTVAVRPGQAIHLTHTPQLRWPSTVRAFLTPDPADVEVTSFQDEVQANLPTTMTADQDTLLVVLTSTSTVVQCGGAASCSAEVSTDVTQPISVQR